MNRHPSSIALAVLGLALGASAAAQVVPDAGQTLRDLQRPPEQPAIRPAPTLVLPAENASSDAAGPRFVVKSITLDGARLVPIAEIQPILDSVSGREVSLGELREAARRITALYRERGYLLARAYVPAQELTDGSVKIQVLEGNLGATHVNNRSRVSQRVVDGVVAAQSPAGEAIRAERTDRALLLLADLPGAGQVNGTLAPGQAVGTSDLQIELAPGQFVEGDVSLDNAGNRYTGQNRLNGHVAINSPLGLGDRVDLRVTHSDRNLNYGRAAFDLPVASDGLRIGTAVSTSRYALAREFAALQASGTARALDVYGSYPLLRSLPANVWLAATLERRLLKDDVASADAESRKSANAATLEAYGDRTDALLGGGFTNWRVAVTSGSLTIGTPAALANDQAGPHASGRYDKLATSVRRQQAITASTRINLALSGQWADKNLDSSEKFVLGGAYGVRAYPQGEGSGDEGWLANLELAQTVLPGLEGRAFYDQGHVRYAHTAYAPGVETRMLRGYGIGAGAAVAGLTLKLDVAWRGSSAAVTAPDHRPRVWAQSEWRF